MRPAAGVGVWFGGFRAVREAPSAAPSLSPHPGHFRASVRLRLYPVSWRRHQVCLGAGSSGVTGQ